MDLLLFSTDSLPNYLHGLPVIFTDCRTGALLPWCYGYVPGQSLIYTNWFREVRILASNKLSFRDSHLTLYSQLVHSYTTLLLTIPCLVHIAWWSISQIHWLCRRKTKICTFKLFDKVLPFLLAKKRSNWTGFESPNYDNIVRDSLIYPVSIIVLDKEKSWMWTQNNLLGC